MADPFQSDWIPSQFSKELGNVAIPQSADQYAAIPSGTLYQDPVDGQVKRKGGGSLTAEPTQWHPFNSRNGGSMLVNEKTGEVKPLAGEAGQSEEDRITEREKRAELLSAQRAYDAADRAWRATSTNPAHIVPASPATPEHGHLWWYHPAAPETKAGPNENDPDVQKAKAAFEAAKDVLGDKKNDLQSYEDAGKLPESILPTAMQNPSNQLPSVATPQGTSGYLNPMDLITKQGSDGHSYKVLPTSRIEVGGQTIIAPDAGGSSLPPALNPAQSALPDFGTPVASPQGTSGSVIPPIGGTTPQGTSQFNSADDVKAAYKTGKISYDQAVKELQGNFKMQ